MVSVLTRFSLPAEVQMFSVMKCLQPTSVAVERANGHRVFAQSHGRSFRAVAFAVGRWSSSMVKSLPWCSAIVVSQFLTQASSSHGRRLWFPKKQRSTVRTGAKSMWRNPVFSPQ